MIIDCHYSYDDTKRYIDAIEWLERSDREKIFEKNVGKVYPSLRRTQHESGMTRTHNRGVRLSSKFGNSAAP